MQLLYVIIGITLIGSTICEERVVGWNKAHGLWGKRSAAAMDTLEQQADKRTVQNWNKLNSLWGKRSMGAAFDVVDDEIPVFYKRSSAQWQRANGLWGR